MSLWPYLWCSPNYICFAIFCVSSFCFFNLELVLRFFFFYIIHNRRRDKTKEFLTKFGENRNSLKLLEKRQFIENFKKQHERYIKRQAEEEDSGQSDVMTRLRSYRAGRNRQESWYVEKHDHPKLLACHLLLYDHHSWTKNSQKKLSYDTVFMLIYSIFHMPFTWHSTLISLHFTCTFFILYKSVVLLRASKSSVLVV